MTEAIGVAEIVIRKPLDVVRRQFLDLDHHVTAAVHPDVEIADRTRDGEAWLYLQGVRAMGAVRRNRVRLEPGDGGTVRLAFLSGPDEGTLQTVSFERVEAGATRVKSVTTVPLRGLMKLMRPFVARQVAAIAQRALEQDRSDLEQHAHWQRA